MSNDIRVCLIDAFDGPRHDRLKLIWRYFAEDYVKLANIVIYCNKGIPLRHGQMLEKIWHERSRWPEQYVIFTEFDFLPNRKEFFKPVEHTNLDYPIAATEYVIRCPNTLELTHYIRPAAWYVCIDRKYKNDSLTFDHKPDPCNELEDCKLLRNLDGRPEHYGTELEIGTHLFFSRHYNDSPEGRVAGLSLFDILAGVDRRIDRYIKTEMK